VNTPFYESPAFRGNGNSYVLNGIEVVGANRSPCPVCGHPTGDCSGGSDKPVIHSSPIFFLEDDVYEDKPITSTLTTRVVKYRKGTNIPMAEAIRLGLVSE
jgi:hypothetical protein